MTKNIFITGGTSGIGKATAALAASHGHRVFITGRDEAKTKALVEELNLAGYAVTDVIDTDGVTKAVAKAFETLGSLDVVLNNAGLGIFDPLEEAKLVDWHYMVDVNIKGLLSVVHATLPHLVNSNGQMINLGSIASHFVFPNSGVYCATKHAVFAISESLRTELSKKIRVTTISPGSVNTPFVEQTKNEELLQNLRPSFAAGMPVEWIAEQIVHAIEVPKGVNVSEIIMRPFNP